MQKIKISLVIVFFFLPSCTSSYFSNRFKDSKDFFTISIEKKVYGTSFFIWCIGGGLQKGSGGEGFGLRNGHFGEYYTGESGKISDRYALNRCLGCRNSRIISQIKYLIHYGDSILIQNSTEFIIKNEPQIINNKSKNMKIANIFFFPDIPYETSATEELPKPAGYLDQNLDPKCNAPFTTEFSLGLYYGFRVGFNFSEAFDFVVGFFGFDPMEDDYNSKGELPKIKEPETFEEYQNRRASKPQE